VRIRSERLGVLVRFVGAVLLLSGVLLVADGVLTLVWREPVTSFLAARAQANLDRELKQLPAPAAVAGTGEQTLSRARVARLARAARGQARVGHAIGTIELPSLHRHYAVVQGTDAASLRKGPGHYPRTPFPGEGGTVAIAGHRTTYLAPFRTIDHLHRGDVIRLVMPYARLEYVVTHERVVVPTDLSILRRVDHEQLVLTACHPLYSASHRLVAFARLRSVQAPSAKP
jgi:sortase A